MAITGYFRNGSLIITSRSREAALKMVAHKNLIEVKSMEQSEALELLRKKLEQSEEGQHSRKLVEALDRSQQCVQESAGLPRNFIKTW